MTEITNNQLDELLLRFRRNLNTQWQERNDIYELAYNTGIRISEAIKPELWYSKQGSDYELTTLKWNLIREIPRNLVPTSLQNFYDNQYNGFYFTYDMLRHDMSKEFPKMIFNGNTHHSVTHAFRYNYIKKQYDLGMKMEELQQHIGHKKIETTQYYVNAGIFADIEPDIPKN